MMVSENAKYVSEKVLHEIARKHGFTNPRVEFSVATKKTDNFIGQLLRCVVTDGKDSKKKLGLMVKQLPPEEEQSLRKAFSVLPLFSTEVFMYGTVLPTLARCFQIKNTLPQPEEAIFPCTARTYALRDEGQIKLIVMEDLKEKGFVMKDRHVGLDEVHCRLVLKQLARFHAASLALQRDGPKLHDSLTDRLTENLFASEQLGQYLPVCLDRFRAVINEVYPVGTPVRNKVEAFLQNYHANVKELVSRNSSLCCVTHGDLWLNNLLFKYNQGSDTIESVCFLDFQMSRFCSPVIDIWYFLGLCTRRSTRKSYHHFIQCYYESLCSFLRDLNHDPEEIVPWSLLQAELRKYGSFGWAVALMVLPPILFGEAEREAMEKTWTTLSEYPQETKIRLIELVQDAEELGYL